MIQGEKAGKLCSLIQTLKKHGEIGYWMMSCWGLSQVDWSPPKLIETDQETECMWILKVSCFFFSAEPEAWGKPWKNYWRNKSSTFRIRISTPKFSSKGMPFGLLRRQRNSPDRRSRHRGPSHEICWSPGSSLLFSPAEVSSTFSWLLWLSHLLGYNTCGSLTCKCISFS